MSTKYSREEYTAYPETIQDLYKPDKWEIRIYNRGADGKLLGKFSVKGSKQEVINAMDARMEQYRKKN